MGAPVYQQKGGGRCRAGVIPPLPLPLYPAVMPVYLPPPIYPGALPPAPKQQHSQAVRATWEAQEGKGEELRRAWERIGEGKRRLQEREAWPTGEAAGATRVHARGQGTPGRREAQAVVELQHTWADVRRRLERVERGKWDGEQQGTRAEGSKGMASRRPLQPFRQPGIPPEAGREVQERACNRIRGGAARLDERDREVAERERRVRDEEAVVADKGHRVIVDPEGHIPATNREGRWRRGKRGRRRRWACAGKAAPSEGAGSRGGNGGAAARQPHPGAHADRLGFGVTAATAFCAASCGEGAGDGLGMEGAEGGKVWPLREVGGGAERGAEAARDPPVPQLGPQGGKDAGQGAGDGGR